MAGCAPERNVAFEDLMLDEQSSGGVVDLANVVAGEWDRACVIQPYTQPDHASEGTGIRWSGFRRSGIKSRDDVSLLVFARGSEAVEGFLVGRQVVFDVRTTTCVSRENAKFTIARSKDPLDRARLAPVVEE
jgi:hypothetical protein